MYFMEGIGGSEIVSIANGILEGNFLIDQMCSPFIAHEPISAANFELKFENAPGNDHQVFVKSHRNIFEGNSEGIKIWRRQTPNGVRFRSFNSLVIDRW
jgi:hypothetical protein